jgi:superfamily II DNA or RNA helicase
MSEITYHLESESGNTKNFPLLLLTGLPKSGWTKDTLARHPCSASEKNALELLLKEQKKGALPPVFDRFMLSSGRSFEILRLLGTTGRVFFQRKKVFIDPFTPCDFYFEAERISPEKAVFTGRLVNGTQAFSLNTCSLCVAATPSWVLKEGIIRPIHESIVAEWIEKALSGPFSLEGLPLFRFLEKAEGEIRIEWKIGQAEVTLEPLPFLTLTDRHGGFADLWFDYGSYGKIAVHDPHSFPWRNLPTEKSWEKDLLETGFLKKTVGSSHYYCPLDKVTKSLTFLLEIGWHVFDATGKKICRQKKVELDAAMTAEKILVRGKVHYGEHLVDLKDLVGAFNRREQFVELSTKEVALIDREEFGSNWEELCKEEITEEGIAVKKNRFGLLDSLFEQHPHFCREGLKEKLTAMYRRDSDLPAQPGSDFQGQLFPWQNEGLQWLNFLQERRFGGLLADEMGLGKTVQVLAFFSQVTFTKPSLIVVPTSLLFNWQREFEKFLPSCTLYRHESKDRLQTKEALLQKTVILTSYAILRLDAILLQEIDYQSVVLDEAQSIKNPGSQISQLCSMLRADMRLAITGTPIENRLEDLWSLFRFLEPDLLGDRKQFQAEIMAASLNTKALDRIKKKIRPFLLRRKKEQIALQMPPKLEQTVFIEMSEEERQTYDRWLQNTRKGLLKKVSLDGASAHRMEILEAILRLRQLCAHPWLVEAPTENSPEHSSAKLERLLSDLGEAIDEGRKVLVYSQFTSMLKLIEKAIHPKGWRYVYLDGSTKEREEAVRTFQEDPDVPLFLISLKAGGVGLNLTAADYVFLYDPWWNEAVERQAIDRAHRLGRSGTVIARRYITALSIEEKIMRLKTHKTTLSHSMLESDEALERVSLEDLLLLLQ